MLNAKSELKGSSDLLSYEEEQALLAEAKKALSLSYAPYSNVNVGAALLSRSGRTYIGANIGNSCSTLNCCAEQAAIIRAVLVKDYPFKAIAVVQSSEGACPPCGRCLQLLAEFSDEMVIIGLDREGPVRWRLSYLLPVPFRRSESSHQ